MRPGGRFRTTDADRTMAERDYYDILDVSRDASQDEIKRSYRKLARELHPDVNKAPDAEKRFSEVQEAYAVLSDPEKRKKYDQFGKAGLGAGFEEAGQAYGGRGGGRGGTYTWTNVGGDSAGAGGVSAEDLSSIFEEMFGGRPGGGGARSPFGGGRGGGPGAGQRTRARPAQRGQDLRHEIDITFYTAVKGGKETLRLTKHTPAGPREETITVTIPAGVADGAKLRLAGKGHPGPAGNGDLILTVRVGGHPYFRRDGLDLLLDVPISIVEAALGANVEVPLYPEGSAEIRIPPGASSGQKLRLRGKGIRNDKGKAGDLFAVIKIVAPKELSEADRAKLREIGEHLPTVRTGRPWVER
jgi:DnaJ-class molecular chaperone